MRLCYKVDGDDNDNGKLVTNVEIDIACSVMHSMERMRNCGQWPVVFSWELSISNSYAQQQNVRLIVCAWVRTDGFGRKIQHIHFLANDTLLSRAPQIIKWQQINYHTNAYFSLFRTRVCVVAAKISQYRPNTQAGKSHAKVIDLWNRAFIFFYCYQQAKCYTRGKLMKKMIFN